MPENREFDFVDGPDHSGRWEFALQLAVMPMNGRQSLRLIHRTRSYTRLVCEVSTTTGAIRSDQLDDILQRLCKMVTEHVVTGAGVQMLLVDPGVTS